MTRTFQPSPPCPHDPPAPRVRSLIRTSDVDEARLAFGRLYGDATIDPPRHHAFGCALDVVPCGAVNVVASSWSGGGRAAGPTFGDRYGLWSVARGVGSGEHRGASLAVEPGRCGALISPGRPFVFMARAGHEGRIITIERSALEAHLAALLGSAVKPPVQFDAPVDFERGAGPTLLAIAQAFRREAARPDASPLLVASLRDALFTALLTGVPHSASSLLEPPPARAAPACVRRAEEYIAAHAHEPIGLADIVAASGAPARSLRALFAARHGMTPLAFLRERRLALARRRLVEGAPGTTVAGVAAALGLGDARRFDAAYRKRFGESPHQALADGLGGPARGFVAPSAPLPTEYEEAARLATLTPREREVCDRVARGMLNKQIAADLRISEWTVIEHRGRAFRKLGVGSAAELGRLVGRLRGG
ncbi:helix-turn-helix domain-containing protein [Sorangium sp. So ce124]|uniref:helix-turn-helix domain-containing protein n=1 Tax=Sorangium sp. So ce124 TaxID=3133280 RepID=UPI003F61E61F